METHMILNYFVIIINMKTHDEDLNLFSETFGHQLYEFMYFFPDL